MFPPEQIFSVAAELQTPVMILRSEWRPVNHHGGFKLQVKFCKANCDCMRSIGAYTAANRRVWPL
jgi:hypothetical protein